MPNPWKYRKVIIKKAKSLEDLIHRDMRSHPKEQATVFTTMLILEAWRARTCKS